MTASTSSATARRRLPLERKSIVHEFDIAGLSGTITVGLYDDGAPGEVFLQVAKQGTFTSGLCDAVGLLTSMNLQHGVPLRDMAKKFEGTRFEPAGVTDNPAIPHANSVLAYVFEWLTLKFPNS